jgi:hypothetical protein
MNREPRDTSSKVPVSLRYNIVPANRRGKPTGKPLSAIKQKLVLETLTANDGLPTKERMLTTEMGENLGISERQLVRMRANLRRYGFVIKPVVKSSVAYQEPENMHDAIRKYLKGQYCGNCGHNCTAAKRKTERRVPEPKEVEVKLAGFTETQLRGLVICAGQNSDWVERLVNEAHRTVFARPIDQDERDIAEDVTFRSRCVERARHRSRHEGSSSALDLSEHFGNPVRVVNHFSGRGQSRCIGYLTCKRGNGFCFGRPNLDAFPAFGGRITPGLSAEAFSGSQCCLSRRLWTTCGRVSHSTFDRSARIDV